MSSFSNVIISGVSHVDPPAFVSSEEIGHRLKSLLDRIELPETVVSEMMGVEHRGQWPQGFKISDIATLAAKKLLNQLDISPDELDIVINISVCRDYFEPSIASIVCGNIGVNNNCINFDVTNACLSAFNSIEIIGNMIERGQVRRGLVVNGENSRIVIDNTIRSLLDGPHTREHFYENLATLGLGSISSAFLVSDESLAKSGYKVHNVLTRSATAYNGLCFGNNDGMYTNATGLLEKGLELAFATYQEAAEQYGWNHTAPDEVVMHQVGKAHLRKSMKLFGLNENKVLPLYPKYGNVGPGSVVLGLSKAAEASRLKADSRLALMGIGSGINCSMAQITC